MPTQNASHIHFLTLTPERNRHLRRAILSERIAIISHIIDQLEQACRKGIAPVPEGRAYPAERKHQLAGTLSGGEQQMVAM